MRLVVALAATVFRVCAYAQLEWFTTGQRIEFTKAPLPTVH